MGPRVPSAALARPPPLGSPPPRRLLTVPRRCRPPRHRLPRTAGSSRLRFHRVCSPGSQHVARGPREHRLPDPRLLRPFTTGAASADASAHEGAPRAWAAGSWGRRFSTGGRRERGPLSSGLRVFKADGPAGRRDRRAPRPRLCGAQGIGVRADRPSAGVSENTAPGPESRGPRRSACRQCEPWDGDGDTAGR